MCSALPPSGQLSRSVDASSVQGTGRSLLLSLWCVKSWGSGRSPVCPCGPGGTISVEMLAALLTIPSCLQSQDRGEGPRPHTWLRPWRGRSEVGGESRGPSFSQGIACLQVLDCPAAAGSREILFPALASQFFIRPPLCSHVPSFLWETSSYSLAARLLGGRITEHVDSSTLPCPCIKRHSLLPKMSGHDGATSHDRGLCCVPQGRTKWLP